MNFLHQGLIELGFDKGNFCGIPLCPLDKLENSLEQYTKILLEYNEKFDLINSHDYDETIIRHILDSLSGAAIIAEFAEKICAKEKRKPLITDIGSGAGLPGIPLALAFPSLSFTLVERMTKRCSFLEHCISALKIENACVEENQVERLDQKKFDLCVFRAFRPLEKKMTKFLLRILKDNGSLLAYKAKLQKITEEMDALGRMQDSYIIKKLTVPFLTENCSGDERERHLLIINR